MKLQGPLSPPARPILPRLQTTVRSESIDTLESAQSPPLPAWRKLLQRAGKGILGGAVGAVPVAGAGYLIAMLGGIPGAIVGGVVGSAIGYVAGRELYEAAKKVENPNKTQKLMLKCGKAAPYIWAAWDGIECAAAGALSPLLAAAIFARKGASAGATIAALRG